MSTADRSAGGTMTSNIFLSHVILMIWDHFSESKSISLLPSRQGLLLEAPVHWKETHNSQGETAQDVQETNSWFLMNVKRGLFGKRE